MGLLGNVNPVGDGIYKLCTHLGAGWRVYFTRQAGRVIALLAGGSKRTPKGRAVNSGLACRLGALYTLIIMVP